jgi:hypothetical protein
MEYGKWLYRFEILPEVDATYLNYVDLDILCGIVSLDF